MAGQPTHSSAQVVWFWECKSLGLYFHSLHLMQLAVWILHFLMLKSCICAGKRGTKYILHLFPILSCSWTYLRCYWVQYSDRYLVSWLRARRATYWAGSTILFTLRYHLLIFSRFVASWWPFYSINASPSSLVRVESISLLKLLRWSDGSLLETFFYPPIQWRMWCSFPFDKMFLCWFTDYS